jgi:hypothetical protein
MSIANHPDLAVLVARWPALPEATKAAILAMVQADQDSQSQTSRPMPNGPNTTPPQN